MRSRSVSSKCPKKPLGTRAPRNSIKRHVPHREALLRDTAINIEAIDRSIVVRPVEDLKQLEAHSNTALRPYRHSHREA